MSGAKSKYMLLSTELLFPFGTSLLDEYLDETVVNE